MHFYLETAQGTRKNPDFHPQQQSGHATPGISMKYGKKLFLGDFHESGFPEILKKGWFRICLQQAVPDLSCGHLPAFYIQTADLPPLGEAAKAHRDYPPNADGLDKELQTSFQIEISTNY